MKAFLAALGFLTRIPVPAKVFEDTSARTESLPWYPLIGLLLGGVLGCIAWLLRDVPNVLSAALVVSAWVVITGGLHLDGLADSADAWVGGLGSREKTLQIMKDPRCGPVGVVALILTLVLKGAALTALSSTPWAELVLAPLLARMTLVALFITTPYVRISGLGEALSSAPRNACAIAIAATAGFCLLGRWRGVLALLAAAVVFGFWRRACMRRLGGTTGDTAGALTELVEVAVLVVLALR